ncbi:MAG: hypothetical protein ABSF46_25370 [Terriglobia bacterium]|jgi:predicted house-cleaning NTP pyrophosphatase (Maf/HAM1 superfamily)
MLSPGQHVIAYQPVAGYYLVKPGKTTFVGVAAIAVLFEYLPDLWRRLYLRRGRPGRNAGPNKLQ